MAEAAKPKPQPTPPPTPLVVIGSSLPLEYELDKAEMASCDYEGSKKRSTTHPTQEDINRAIDEDKIVAVFLRAPGAQTQGEVDIYSAALLQAWGLRPDSRLIINVVSPDLDIEFGREAWIQSILDQMENQPWRERPGVSSTSLSGANFLRKEDLDEEGIHDQGSQVRGAKQGGAVGTAGGGNNQKAGPANPPPQQGGTKAS